MVTTTAGPGCVPAGFYVRDEQHQGYVFVALTQGQNAWATRHKKQRGHGSYALLLSGHPGRPEQ